MPEPTIRSLIIDDDPFIRELLKDKLNQYLPHVEILAMAGSGTEGLAVIHTLRPDLIFLDVEMADMTGFEMLAKLDTISFQTIFITSYSHYAIKAIRFNALDYLVKPIDLGELKAALQRFEEKRRNPTAGNPVSQALENLNNPTVGEQKLVLQTQEGEIRLPVKTIIRIEGESNYSCIYLTNKKKKIASKTLSALEEILEDKGFFRCHKSHLINKDHIKKLLTSNSILLTDETEIPIARRKKEDFQEWMQSMGNIGCEQLFPGLKCMATNTPLPSPG